MVRALGVATVCTGSWHAWGQEAFERFAPIITLGTVMVAVAVWLVLTASSIADGASSCSCLVASKKEDFQVCGTEWRTDEVKVGSQLKCLLQSHQELSVMPHVEMCNGHARVQAFTHIRCWSL